MKYLWRALVVIFCVVIVIGFAIMSKALPESKNNMFFEHYQNMRQVYENTFELSKVKNIRINYCSEDVEIYPSESSQLEIKEYMNFDPKDSELSSLWRTGDTLAIEEGDREMFFFFVFGNQKRIEIYIPQDFQGALSVELGSGELNIGMDMVLSEFNIDMQSGKAVIGKIDAEQTDIGLTSGHISIEELTGRQNVDVSSGSVDLKLATGEGKYHCSSGKIGLKVSELRGDMDLDVSSGKIEVLLPEDSEFVYESKISSGDADTYFETERVNDHEQEATIGSNPSDRIKVDVCSGKVKLEQY